MYLCPFQMPPPPFRQKSSCGYPHRQGSASCIWVGAPESLDFKPQKINSVAVCRDELPSESKTVHASFGDELTPLHKRTLLDPGRQGHCGQPVGFGGAMRVPSVSMQFLRGGRRSAKRTEPKSQDCLAVEATCSHAKSMEGVAPSSQDSHVNSKSSDMGARRRSTSNSTCCCVSIGRPGWSLRGLSP